VVKRVIVTMNMEMLGSLRLRRPASTFVYQGSQELTDIELLAAYLMTCDDYIQ